MISAALAVLETDEQRNELFEFYEKNINCLLNYALNLLHNEEETEDAVQEAFLQIADKPDVFFRLATLNVSVIRTHRFLKPQRSTTAL